MWAAALPAARVGSAPGEAWRTALEEGLALFTGVVDGPAADGDGVDLLAELGIEVVVPAPLDDAAGHDGGDRRERGDLAGDGAGFVEQAFVRDESLEEADAEGFGGIDGTTGEDEVEGVALADDAREEIAHAGIWGEVALDEDGFEAGVLAADADIAGEGEGESGACGDAVDGGDGRLVDVVDGAGLPADPALFIGELLPGDMLGRFGGRAGDVGAGAEAAAGAGEDDGADGVVLLQGGTDVEDLSLEGAVERVEFFRPLEGDGCDVVRDFEDQVLEGHGAPRRRRCGGVKRIAVGLSSGVWCGRWGTRPDRCRYW